MRQCASCSKTFPDEMSFCPYDGSRLDETDPLVGTTLGGKYHIDALIGVGAVGAVYRATQTNLARTVAIKVVRTDALGDSVNLERLKREAHAVARLAHPHIVTIYEFSLAEDIGAYLVMELIEGELLSREIAAGGPMREDRAVELMQQICSAVDAAHEAGVIHRDLKPDNIILERAPQGAVAKVLDFGVAKLQGGNQSVSAPLTAIGELLGSPLYMSPEQCKALPADTRSDIYSLGCILFEMLTGRPPFAGDTVLDLALKHATEAPQPPSSLVPEVSPALDNVVLRALAKRPEARYQTASEFATALMRYRSARLA